jgi:lactoylglutathione lyase
MPDAGQTTYPQPRLAHVALWTRDLERMARFYAELLGAEVGPLYTNPHTGFRSRFARFAGAAVELMTRPDVAGRASGDPATPTSPSEGYPHVALELDSRQAVDETLERLRQRGVRIVGAARQTGDGYYEAVIADPDGNLIEIVA